MSKYYVFKTNFQRQIYFGRILERHNHGLTVLILDKTGTNPYETVFNNNYVPRLDAIGGLLYG